MFSLLTRFSLADGPWESAKLIFWYLSLQYKKRFLRITDPALPLQLRLHWKEHRFIFEVRTIIDLHVVNEVFLTNEYVFTPEKPISSMLDIGANIGASVVCFALLFPHARIAAFEPNPNCFSSLIKNTAQFGERIILHQEAITETNASITFYTNQEHWGGSLMKRSEGSSYQVNGVTLKTALQKLHWSHVDFVKMDIEGGEYAVAQDLHSLHPETIIAEVHPDITGIPYEAFRESFPDYEDRMYYQHNQRKVIQLVRTDDMVSYPV